LRASRPAGKVVGSNPSTSTTFLLYILRSETSGRFYVGTCADLVDRLTRHNENRSKSTRARGPWVVVYTETFSTRAEALERERQIKAWKSHRSIEELVASVAELPG